MFPELTLPFGIHLPTYGIFLALAHLLGVTIFLLSVHRHRLPLSPIVDLIFIVIFSGLAGARVLYVLGHGAEFSGQGLKFLRLWEGGLSFYGGFFAAFPIYFAYLYLRGLPVFTISDLAAPILPLCMGIIRLGCLCAGCCYGLPTRLPWGVHLHSELVPPELRPLALHPTQLYESFSLFVLAGILFWLAEKKILPRGVLATGSIMAYALLRIGLDFFRADIDRNFLLSWLSFSQIAAVFVFLCGIGLLAYLCRGKNLLQ
jgi:phosphatidylglycerol:prolipoprotein diacylglycerol transferase